MERTNLKTENVQTENVQTENVVRNSALLSAPDRDEITSLPSKRRKIMEQHPFDREVDESVMLRPGRIVAMEGAEGGEDCAAGASRTDFAAYEREVGEATYIRMMGVLERLIKRIFPTSTRRDVETIECSGKIVAITVVDPVEFPPCDHPRFQEGRQIQLRVVPELPPQLIAVPFCGHCGGAVELHPEGDALDALQEWYDGEASGIFAHPGDLYRRIMSFNFRHFMIDGGSSYIVMRSDGPKQFGRGTFMNGNEHLAPLYVTNAKGKVIPKAFVELWMMSPLKRMYERTDFLPPPRVCPPSTFNSWMGFAVDTGEFEFTEEAIAELVAPILEHFLTLTNGCLAGQAFFLDWLADIIQNPGRLNPVFIIIIGDQGCGKGMVYGDLLEPMIGEPYCVISCQARQLFGHFNASTSRKLLAVYDEMNRADSKGYLDQLKHATGSAKRMIERKGIDPVSETNSTRYLGFSNSGMPVDIPSDQEERRACILEASSYYCDQPEYFDKLGSHLKRPEVRYAFFKHLQGRDISGRNWSRDRPRSQLYASIRESSVPLFVKVLHNILAVVEARQFEVTCASLYESMRALSIILFGNDQKVEGSIATGRKMKQLFISTKRDPAAVERGEVDARGRAFLQTGISPSKKGGQRGYTIDKDAALRFLVLRYNLDTEPLYMVDDVRNIGFTPVDEGYNKAGDRVNVDFYALKSKYGANSD